MRALIAVLYVHRDSQSLIQFSNLNFRQGADVISEQWLWNADQLIAMDCAVVFQPRFRADRDLRRYPVKPGIDGSACYRWKGGIKYHLSAYNDENAVLPGIKFIALVHAIQITSFQNCAWYVKTSPASSLRKPDDSLIFWRSSWSRSWCLRKSRYFHSAFSIKSERPPSGTYRLTWSRISGDNETEVLIRIFRVYHQGGRKANFISFLEKLALLLILPVSYDKLLPLKN